MSEDTSGSSASGGVPFHLMPLAAVSGTYFVLALINLLYIVYKNATHKKESTMIPPTPVKSRKVLILVISIIVSVLCYGYIVGQVEKALLEDTFSNTVFDPYDILEISQTSTTSEVKQAFRSLSKVHHPDKGGDERLFHHITLAYKALTDPVAKLNYEQYGHPDGKPSSPTLNFALPDWLLHPKGNVALFLVLMYLGLFVGIIVYALKFVKNTEQTQKQKAKTMSVAGSDAAYLAMKLNPTSSHWDVLFYLATTPENIDITSKDLEKISKIRDEKLEKIKKEEEAAKKINAIAIDDDGGWASDDEDESDEVKAAAAALKKAEEDKKKEIQSLNNSMGKKPDIADIKLEGIDKGVLGQDWVLQQLVNHKVWPPQIPKDAGTFKDSTSGKVCEALDHPAVKRNILMTMGRLNAVVLNLHPDLTKAASKGDIDQTYFKNTLEFRQRNGLLLEAALRVACAAKSYRLAKTIVEAASMFKIGTMSATADVNVNWFRSTMEKQYGGKDGIPVLNIKDKKIETPGEEEIATRDALMLSVDIERLHAEAFTKQKMMMCQKQGIPPQLVFQTYKEVYWVFVRASRKDGKSATETSSEAKSPLSNLLSDPKAIQRFEDESDENKLLTAFPFVCSNIMKKEGTVKVQFKAPETPGKYTFHVALMSQDFLGVDKDFVIENIEILDVEDVQRKQAEEEKEDAEVEEEETEGKKTK